MVEFLCPNGHKIHCPDEQAGRAAKCPRCGVKFRIPELSDLTPTQTRHSDSNISAPELTDSNGSSTSLSSGHPQDLSTEQSIEFLCPRGHHLHGPASLQGRPGECPECGSRFRIPTLDDAPPAAPIDEEISLEGAETRQGRAVEDVSPQHVVDFSRPSEPSRGQPSPGDSSPSVSLPPGFLLNQGAASHPLADLFTKLWAAKGDGSRVEIHLSTGGILLPDDFARTLSQQHHAVFVTRDPDNSYTLTVVPWDGVTRVILRGVQQVPGEMA